MSKQLADEQTKTADIADAQAALEAGEFTPLEEFAAEMGWEEEECQND